MSDNELGLFLRTRRAAITPAEVGLPVAPRRRATGLLRSEVAALARVSVEYVTRLEQGRDRRPSPQILAALADALRLSADERAHLLRLTKAADPGFSCLGARRPAHTVRPTVRAVVEQLDPAPAVLLNRLGDVLAYTAAYERLMGPIGLLEPARPNLTRFVLTDERARKAYPDWERVADEEVAALKQGSFRADPHIAALADELALTAGEVFTRRVETVPGLADPNGSLRLSHPSAGELRLLYEVLDLPAGDDQRLVVHLAADTATERALDRLRPQPIRLLAG
ncbi:helix-turn-helix transcriptional regulator [Actinoplanes derwentensis]|uniref:Helix-turn-helix domain-containing protein n=1 Tax=Actinoplanes derwentensis TaxID=113562 RepID=A0A1H1TSB0_9ACTN|nr:helix-turn-helix transcriptional regulator [Actinoplanes derwentensis]GID85120.1 transcriptional regulator [Actinoplanes derwentensis]SDS63163.1 Helix-turn-helix domain-containing protein [Actinoplanes derwentensis]